LPEPLHFYCPFCAASIKVTAALVSSQGEKVKCSGCQRNVEVPESVLSALPDPDDDDDFLSGVPMKASGEEDVLTAADLAINSKELEKSSDLLEKDFEFSIDDGASSAEAQSEQDDDQKEDPPTESNDSDKPLVDTRNKLKTGGDEDLNQLLAGGAAISRPPVEKGTFAIRCSVCDSKLLVSVEKVGKEVKCSDCFSKIKVRPPTAKEKEQIEKQIRLSLEKESNSCDLPTASDGELTLAPLEEDELDEAEVVAEIVGGDGDEPLTLREESVIDPDDGFADVLLDDEDEDDLGEDLLAGDLSLAGPLDLEDAPLVDPAVLATATKTPKDNGEIKQEKINPYRSKSAQQAERRAKEEGYKPKQKKSGKGGPEFPKMRFDAFFGAAVELVTEPSVAVRSLIVAALMAIGNVISHSALSTYNAIDAPTMGDTATMGFWRLGVGWLPYAIGTILLWYFCGVVFREAASGKTKIKSWKLGPTTEWSSTLLITAVSFAIAGSPVLMLMSIYITAPVRFLLALPFLTAVWYTQSPFAIISSDVVTHFRKNGKQWKTVFLVVLALASLAFVAGVLMHVPVPWLNILTSALGAVFLSFVTLAFAAVAGWHSGMVVEELN